MTSLSNILGVIPVGVATKEQVIQEAVDTILSGEREILPTLASLKHMEDVITEVRKHPEVVIHLENELSKYAKGEKPAALGFNFVKSERSSYDFSQTGDVQLMDLYEQMEALKEKIKARETMIKSLTGKIYDPEYGNEINPPVRSITTIISYKAQR